MSISAPLLATCLPGWPGPLAFLELEQLVYLACFQGWPYFSPVHVINLQLQQIFTLSLLGKYIWNAPWMPSCILLEWGENNPAGSIGKCQQPLKLVQCWCGCQITVGLLWDVVWHFLTKLSSSPKGNKDVPIQKHMKKLYTEKLETQSVLISWWMDK